MKDKLLSLPKAKILIPDIYQIGKEKKQSLSKKRKSNPFVRIYVRSGFYFSAVFALISGSLEVRHEQSSHFEQNLEIPMESIAEKQNKSRSFTQERNYRRREFVNIYNSENPEIDIRKSHRN